MIIDFSIEQFEIITTAVDLEDRYSDMSDFYMVTLSDGKKVLCEVHGDDDARLPHETGAFHCQQSGLQVRTSEPASKEFGSVVYGSYIYPHIMQLGKEAGWL